MKRFKINFWGLLLLFAACFLPSAKATEPVVSQRNSIDSVDISLLTCGPGSEVWSLYGHTAIRVEDHRNGTDIAVNYGVFSFHQPYFILRFVFGLTDYEMGVCPMDMFLEEYREEGRWVRQQRLRLTPEEKIQILQALETNYMPANRTYRYNYFYDNCTTRARDMLLAPVKDVRFHYRPGFKSSYREEIHHWNEYRRWARFGNDLLLGIGADRTITQREAEFLPDNLSRDIATTGLVDSTFYILPPQAQILPDEGVTPRAAALALFAVVAILSVVEYKKKKNFRILDLILFLPAGLAGLILTSMIFSEHPTVSVNLQILTLNPLFLFFLWPAMKEARRRQFGWAWKVWTVCLILALIGACFQSYAEGMVFVALTLLLRAALKIKK